VSPTTTTDVVVVGGGPAGAAAAITLARADHDVVVLDRADFPRDKTCGDGLTTLALRRLAELGFDPAPIPSWTAVEDFSIRSPSGRWVRLPLPRDAGLYAAVARRLELDAELLGLARTAGAKVLDACACIGASAAEDHVLVETANGEAIRTRYLIDTNGM
jgi:flavin-dependent dehydrogenase